MVTNRTLIHITRIEIAGISRADTVERVLETYGTYYSKTGQHITYRSSLCKMLGRRGIGKIVKLQFLLRATNYG